MGMERISFGAYLKRTSPVALISYFAGLGLIVLLN